MKIQMKNIAVIAVISGFSTAVIAQNISDIDGDGVISVEEVRAAKEARKAEVIAQFDVDGDGELSEEERLAAKDARGEQRLAAFDSDNDGELSREERRAAREDRRETFAASFDLDGSGDLSETEQANLDDVRSEIRSERGGRQRGGKGRNR